MFGEALGSQPGEGRWEQIRSVMEQMTARNRYVFVDPPPLDRSADTLAIASQVDIILLVVSDRTPVEAVIKAKDELAGIGRKVAGYVRIRPSGRRIKSSMGLATGRIPTAVQIDVNSLTPLEPGAGASPLELNNPDTKQTDPLKGREIPYDTPDKPEP